MEIDLHQMTVQQARAAVQAALNRVTSADYRLRVIHGYRGGNALKEMLHEDFIGHPKVLRFEGTLNRGETILLLREYF